MNWISQPLVSVSVVATPYLGLVSTKGRIPDAFTSSGTYLSANSSNDTWARDTITSVQIAVANSYVPTNTSAETGVGNSITVTASVQYPIANTSSGFNQVLFSGSPSFTLPDNSMVISDLVSLATTIPKGTKYRIRFYIIVPASSSIPFNVEHLGSADVIFVNPGVGSDLTMGGVIGSLSGDVGLNGVFPHLGAIALTITPTVVICGDSISAGVGGQQTNSFGDIGPAARALGPFFGYSKFAQSGNLMSQWVSSGSPIRRTMFGFSSHVVNCLGANDFALPSAASSGIANAQTMWGWAHAAGAKAFHPTMTPRTSSASNAASSPPGVWVDPPGAQTTTMIGGLTGFWKTFNDGLRAGSLGADGFFDPAAQVEFNATDSGLWDENPDDPPIVGGTYGTGDGVTLTYTHTLAAPNSLLGQCVIPGTVTITAGAVIATDDGSGNFTGAGVTSGTINYNSRACSITYSSAPSGAITANYTMGNVLTTDGTHPTENGALREIAGFNPALIHYP